MTPLPHTPEAPPRKSGSSPWLRRSDLFVRVIVRLYIGMLLVVLPWTHIWDDNHLLSYIPYLSTVALSGVVRGVASGLGLLNMWIAAAEAMNYREH
ncbi:hypothetical protein C7378_2173 [Acidipila rosea]|uniref:Uncharacterized protein n=1 Tax=Acidipila rosea TaxID=768535 RepID=A0A4R1L3H1_9BACT|nr:hypothetical protein C7378_2173 [Acidipila rosea]